MSVNPAIAAAAKQMAQSKVFGDYVYLSKKFGRYKCRVMATKVKEGGPKCIAELKVLEVTKTQESEPHRVGDVVSYLENLADPRKGGGSRFQKMMLTALGMQESEITRLEFVENGVKTILSGEDAKSYWFAKMLQEDKLPVVGLLIDVEIYPHTKDGKTNPRERWSTIDPSETEFAEIEKFRADAKLPPLAEALK